MNLDFFSHQADESDMPGLFTLRALYGGGDLGWAMEGRYWALCGLVARAGGYRLNLDEPRNRPYLMAKLGGLSAEVLEKFLTVLHRDCGLIFYDGHVLEIQSLKEDLERLQKKTQAAAAAAGKRWSGKGKKDPEEGKGEPGPSPGPPPQPEECGHDATVMRPECGRNADAFRTHNGRNANRETEGKRDYISLFPSVDDSRERENSRASPAEPSCYTGPVAVPADIPRRLNFPRARSPSCCGLDEVPQKEAEKRGSEGTYQLLFEWARRGASVSPITFFAERLTTGPMVAVAGA